MREILKPDPMIILSKFLVVRSKEFNELYISCHNR